MSIKIIMITVLSIFINFSPLNILNISVDNNVSVDNIKNDVNKSTVNDNENILKVAGKFNVEEPWGNLQLGVPIDDSLNAVSGTRTRLLLNSDPLSNESTA